MTSRLWLRPSLSVNLGRRLNRGALAGQPPHMIIESQLLNRPPGTNPGANTAGAHTHPVRFITFLGEGTLVPCLSNNP